MINNDKILTIDEAAEILKISKPTIYRKLKSGEISAKKVGRSWRFLTSDILDLIKSPASTQTDKKSLIGLPIDIQKISTLCKKNSIALCYLFGSHAGGSPDAASDIDIGIVFLPSVSLDNTGSLFGNIRDQFADMAGAAPIDLIFLQNVGPLIQEQAILGRAIYSVCDFFKTRYEDNVLREAMDFRFFQQRFDKEMIEDIKNGGFFAA